MQKPATENKEDDLSDRQSIISHTNVSIVTSDSFQSLLQKLFDIHPQITQYQVQFNTIYESLHKRYEMIDMKNAPILLLECMDEVDRINLTVGLSESTTEDIKKHVSLILLEAIVLNVYNGEEMIAMTENISIMSAVQNFVRYSAPILIDQYITIRSQSQNKTKSAYTRCFCF